MPDIFERLLKNYGPMVSIEKEPMDILLFLNWKARSEAG